MINVESTFLLPGDAVINGSYATEAAKAMIDYMFNEVEISKIYLSNFSIYPNKFGL